jgi:hypothetical protein
MQKSKGLTLQVAGTFALAMLVGASAFAESRHQGGTRGGGSSRGSGGFSRGSGGSSRGSGGSSRGSGSFSRGSSNRGGYSRSTPSYSRSYSTPRGGSSYGRGGSGYGRGGSSYGRGGSSYGRGGSSYGRGGGGNFYNNGSRFYGRGRVDRVVPFHGGYNVYLGGWGYPFFVPYRFWDPFRFRIGLFVGFNAFYDPLGYYSVYGWPGYPGYYPPPVYTAGPTVYRDGNSDYDNNSNVLSGTVESIDLHTGTIVVIDERSNRRTTALLPPRDRRVDDIRVGDYIELSGSWVRGRNYDFDSDTLNRDDPKR